MAILVEIMYAAVGEEWHGPDCGSADGARGEERWRTADAAVAATEQRCPRASRLLTALRVIAHPSAGPVSGIAVECYVHSDVLQSSWFSSTLHFKAC